MMSFYTEEEFFYIPSIAMSIIVPSRGDISDLYKIYHIEQSLYISVGIEFL